MNQPNLMGPLETVIYRRLWRSSRRFRSDLAASKAAAEDSIKPIDPDLNDHQTDRWVPLREATQRGGSAARGVWPAFCVPPDEVAASLLFARIFDEHPELLRSIHEASPIILIDVADRGMLDQLKHVWGRILFPESDRRKIVHAQTARSQLDVVELFVKELPRATDKDQNANIALNAIRAARPLIAMSPMARSHLPEVLGRAATAKIEFPKLDAETIVRVIRVVTGKLVREPVDANLAERITLDDLVIAVRFDRAAAQCIAELKRLSAGKESMRASRDLTLADLHGLGEARAWAQGAIADIKAWKEGRIPWSQVSSGIALTGPSGCGKTTLASVFCHEAGLHLVSATLAKWQSSGEAHLGHLLRCMRQDFEEARANIPSCIFIDEIDSFPERAGVTHRWRDYVVEVVNALLAEVDGIKGRDGVFVIGASNEIGRCEPALLRAGRLEKVVSIRRPGPTELEQMFRVRLQNDLQEEDVSSIAEAAIGMVGADVERVVKDARRAARQDGGRALRICDLRKALAGEDQLPLEERWRVCVHEAAHLIADIIHFGPQDIFASAVRVGSRGGMTWRARPAPVAGILDDYRKHLQVRLAGMLGEELLLGAASHAAGGERGSDLEHATSLAAAVVGSLGLVGEDHITYFGARDDTQALLLFAEVRHAVARELAAASAATRLLLELRRPAIEIIARRLLTRGRVSGDEAAEVLFKLSRSLEENVDVHSGSNAGKS
ncbi:AAA family ATPase [Bradyrhizobium sp. Bra64]|uniref:AAA family ATPase n=1 Tax=Bradyrhizobium sp. Bra64 TaxID=2926009 RepID=UPI002117D4F5|nr:AAA family ATPase [Bradyrhizobium sp. Bra64]